MKNQDVQKIDNLQRIERDSLGIRWNITRFCNYSCDFCIQGSKEEKRKAAQTESSDTRKKIANKLTVWIEQNISASQIVDLSIIGGEATALPDFLETMSTLVNCQFKGMIYFHLTTNFFRSSKYLTDLCNLFNGHKNRILWLNASFYRNYTTPEIFDQKVRALQRFIIHEKPFHLWQRLFSRVFGLSFVPQLTGILHLSVGWPILDDDSYFEYMKYKEAATQGVNVYPIIMRYYPVTLSEEVQEALKSKSKDGRIRVQTTAGDLIVFQSIQHLGLQLEDAETFQPMGYLCDAGQSCFSVLPDGSVIRCPSFPTPTDFHMGNILDETFQPLKAPAVCHANHCSCQYFKHIERPQ